MITFYQEYIKAGQTLTDLALQEYGHVDGVFLILQDNPSLAGDLQADLEPGAVLNFRMDPPVEFLRRLEYVRQEKVFKLIREGGAAPVSVPGTVKNSAGDTLLNVYPETTPILPDGEVVNSAGIVINDYVPGRPAVAPNGSLTRYYGGTIQVPAGTTVADLKPPLNSVLADATNTAAAINAILIALDKAMPVTVKNSTGATLANPLPGSTYNVPDGVLNRYYGGTINVPAGGVAADIKPPLADVIADATNTPALIRSAADDAGKTVDIIANSSTAQIISGTQLKSAANQVTVAAAILAGMSVADAISVINSSGKLEAAMTEAEASVWGDAFEDKSPTEQTNVRLEVCDTLAGSLTIVNDKSVVGKQEFIRFDVTGYPPAATHAVFAFGDGNPQVIPLSAGAYIQHRFSVAGSYTVRALAVEMATFPALTKNLVTPIVITVNNYLGGYILDGMIILAALGLRRLHANATWCIRLRRGSDDAEMDFGFDSDGNLDTAGIIAWLAGAVGYLRRLYDQSGLGLHLDQAVSGTQLILDLTGTRPRLKSNLSTGAIWTGFAFTRALGENLFFNYVTHNASANLIISSVSGHLSHTNGGAISYRNNVGGTSTLAGPNFNAGPAFFSITFGADTTNTVRAQLNNSLESTAATPAGAWTDTFSSVGSNTPGALVTYFSEIVITRSPTATLTVNQAAYYGF